MDHNMPTCTKCSSWMSVVLDKLVQRQEKTNTNGQEVTRRTVLSIRQNSKQCKFCDFIASEMEIFGEKRDLEITDDQTALIVGNCKEYDFGGELGSSPILESIGFHIYKPTGNESHPWQHSYYLGNYPVCIEADNALSKYILTSLPDSCPVSDSSLKKIRTWIESCNTSHGSCAHTDSSMPSRIIDLIEYTRSGVVKLIEPKGRSGEYVALSHCWGTSRSFMTTTETLDQRKCGIIVQSLPKTFQDAIKITNLLHLQYLWIDSICIIQDDPNDWEKESSQMARVYSNSYVTIAAARSTDDIEGFLDDRTEYIKVDVDFSLGNSAIFVLPIEHDIYSELYMGSLNEMPLHTRAWALQERYLPKRVIHFGRDQTFWECNSIAVGEWEGVGSARASSIDGLLQGVVDASSFVHKSSSTPLWIQPWSTLVDRYSRRKLTIATDRLPALAGLARQIADYTGDRYCAGLWQCGFGYGLCWAAEKTPVKDPSRYELENYQGPTWSWASTNGPVAYFSVIKEATLCAEFLSCDLEIPGQNPYGVVKSGRLKVKAPLIEIHPVAGRGGFPFWDHGRAYPCFALILWDTPSYYIAIAVKPTLREDGEYWKVGFIPQGEGTPYSEGDVQTITLV